MTTELKELGSIKDIRGITYNCYAEHVSFDKEIENVEIHNITMEINEEYFWPVTLKASSLAEMPDRFSQSEINKLEENLILEKRNELMTYLSDLHAESKWEPNV